MFFFKISDFEELVEDKNRFEHFSCGHVIPKENIICLGICTGPNGEKFDFSYNSRDSTKTVRNDLKNINLKNINKTKRSSYLVRRAWQANDQAEFFCSQWNGSIFCFV